MKVSALALLGLCAQGARVSKQAVTKIGGIEVRNVVHGSDDWIVHFPKGTTDEDIERFCLGEICTSHGRPSRGGIAWAAVTGTTQVESALRRRRGTPVSFIEADAWDSVTPIIESMQSEKSWGLEAVGNSKKTLTGKGVNIYVQDTGIRSSHSDFGGRVTSAFDSTRGWFKDDACKDNNEVACAQDGQGHGTHCAGTAGGATYGIANEASIFAVKTLSDNGSGMRHWQYNGIQNVVSHVKDNKLKRAVLSMSLGGPTRDNGYEDAVQTALDNGVVVVVAAGNSNADACNFSPAFASAAITVGATESTGKRAYYSNFGECVNIMAPGSAITSSWNEDDDQSMTISGTSMACPHVSGAVALLLESGDVEAADVRAALMSKARTGMVEDLEEKDPDLFLWVGAAA